MRSLFAAMMVVVAVPTFAQSYGNAGFHSGAYGNYQGGGYGAQYANYGQAYANIGQAYANTAANYGQAYANVGQAYANTAANYAAPYANYGAQLQYAQPVYGNASRYNPYQAENGDYRNYDNDYDGRREPTHVRGHYHSRNGYTQGHYRALPHR